MTTSFRSRRSGQSRGGRLGFAIAGLLAVALAPTAGAAADHYRGRRLADVLRELQRAGLELIYSSAVVGDELRVEVEPAASSPRAVLDAILLPLALEARDGPAGAVVIVPRPGPPVGPPTADLGGRVIATSGAPIAGALVRVPAVGGRAISGRDGRFAVIAVPLGTYEVTVEAPGYVTATRAGVRLVVGAADLTIELTALRRLVTEVVVTPDRHSILLDEVPGRHTVTYDAAALAPNIAGDVSRVVELLPGVTAPDNSAAFHIRGSTAADVAVILDGLELYDPFHLASLQSPFSVVDSHMVDRIEFFGGGYTADRGDRHGGFVDLATLMPAESAHADLEFGTVNTRASYRGPLAGTTTGSFMVAARGWYPEALHHTTQLGGGEGVDPRFADLYVKAAATVASRHQVSAHALMVYDRLTFVNNDAGQIDEVDATTRNDYLWLRAFSGWSPSVDSETVLSVGRIDRQRDGLSEAVTVTDGREVDFFGFEHDLRWQLSDDRAIKAGLFVRRLLADYQYTAVPAGDGTASTTLRLSPVGTSLAGYAAYRTRMGPRLAAEAGVRWDTQSYTDDNQITPRLNVVWQPGERTEVRMALGRFAQSQRIHELRVEDGETGFQRAELADEVEVTVERQLEPWLRLRIDAYARRLTRLQPRYENLFEPIELFPEIIGDRVRLEPGRARLRGLELLVRGPLDRPLVWWASYALAAADDAIGGRYVPRSWDQTHAGKFLLGYRRGERWSMTLSGTVHTGWPTTPIVAELVRKADGSTVVVSGPGGRNSERFPTYARLDLQARRGFELPAGWGRLWLTLQLLNLTDRKNLCCLNEALFEPRADGTVDVRRTFDPWLGITPSVTIRWSL